MQNELKIWNIWSFWLGRQLEHLKLFFACMYHCYLAKWIYFTFIFENTWLWVIITKGQNWSNWSKISEMSNMWNIWSIWLDRQLEPLKSFLACTYHCLALVKWRYLTHIYFADGYMYTKNDFRGFAYQVKKIKYLTFWAHFVNFGPKLTNFDLYLTPHTQIF